MVMSILIGLMIISGVVILDQVSKLLMIYLLADKAGQAISVIGDFFKFKLTFNTGAAWGMFEGKFWLLMTVTAIATIIFIFFAKYADFRKAKTYSIGIYFMIGGMIGNFVDRVFATEKSFLFTNLEAPAHGVTDFISFNFFPAIFNIADSFLCIGVALVLIDIIFFERKRNQDAKFSSEE